MHYEHAYQGYAMRSHSETRWASMMDCMGIRWLYEHKIYKTRHGSYLPDFYLPDAGCFLEVKGPEPTKEEQDKALDVQAETGMPIIFGYGAPKLDGMFVINGFLKHKHVQVSLYEICEGIAKRYGAEKALRFAMAARIQEAPSGVMMGDAVMRYLDSLKSRSVLEAERRAMHAPLNAAKVAMLLPPTLATCYVIATIAVFTGKPNPYKKESRNLRKTESIQQASKRKEGERE